VAVDVYDNDNRRNNPTVFVLSNLEGDKTSWHHDDDFSNDMYQQIPVSADPNTPQAYKCVVDIRNTGKMVKFLVKLLKNVLHVYVDDLDGTGFKFCLAVQFQRSFEDYHLVFTGATGQVADMHDLFYVTTKYLLEGDSVDDSALVALSSEGNLSSFRWLSYILIFVSGFYLVIQSGYCGTIYNQMSKAHLDPVKVCESTNNFFLPQLAAHIGVGILLALNGHYLLALANLPLLAWTIFSFITKTHIFLPTSPSYTGVKRLGLNNVLGSYPRLLLFFHLLLYYANLLCLAYLVTEFSPLASSIAAQQIDRGVESI